MSLPTVMKYYNSEGEIIADYFVNIGWFMSEEGLVRILLESPFVYNAETVELYDMVFPAEVTKTEDHVDDVPQFKSYVEQQVREKAQQYNKRKVS